MRLLAPLLFALALGCTGSIDGSDDPAAPSQTAADETGSPALESDTDAPSDDSAAPVEDTNTTIVDSGIDSAMPKDTSPAIADTSPVIEDAGPSSTRQVEKPLGTTDAKNGYLEYLPPGYGKTGKVPLIVFWHGIGEDGNGTTDLHNVAKNGPPKLIAADKWPNTRPFIVLSPQNASGCPSAGSIKAFIDYAIGHYDVDPKRIYLSGLSCGAIGSWNYLDAYVDTTPIAAAVLIAGNGTGAWDHHKCDLGARIAIWGFHGDADGTVDPNGTIYPMTNLIKCPSPPRKDAEMTIYPGVGHDSWTRTYDGSAGHDVFQWMLDHHL